MKRITFAGGSLITGDAAAEALLDFAAKIMGGSSGVKVELSALNENGTITTHSLLVGPGIQLEVADVDGDSEPGNEEARFPVPELPDGDPVAIVDPSPESLAAQEEFDRAVADLDASLNGETA